MGNFYCKIACVSDDFSIDEWNEGLQYCIDNKLSEAETNKILFPKPCEKQCFDCMAVVGEQRIKTQKLIDKMNSKTASIK